MLISRNPGRMDCKLTLLQPSDSKDGIGATLTTFTTAGTVRAERMFKNSTERFEAMQQSENTIESFRMRDYRSLYNINTKWRFTYDGDTYAIQGIEREGRKNYLIITGLKRDN